MIPTAGSGCIVAAVVVVVAAVAAATTAGTAALEWVVFETACCATASLSVSGGGSCFSADTTGFSVLLVGWVMCDNTVPSIIGEENGQPTKPQPRVTHTRTLDC